MSDVRTDRCFFSIVMPIYNVEKHLRKAIDSILNQSFRDFEVILVDDCSPDGCGKICDEYVEKDGRISVVHLKKNGGLSNARNKGFEHVTGKYVWFPDSDDYYENDILEKVYQAIKENPAELTIMGLQEDYYDSDDQLKYSKSVCMKDERINSQECVRKKLIELESNTLYGYAWNKFYDVSLIRQQNLQFEKITLIEDIVFNVKYCTDISKINILGITSYHYNKRMDNSLTSKFVPEYFRLHRHRVKIILEQYKAWGMCSDDVKKTLSGIYVRYIMSALERNCHKQADMNAYKRYQWISKLFQDSIYIELAPYFEPSSKVTKIAGIAIIGKKKFMCLLLGQAIYIVKTKMPMLFAKVKQKR